MTVHSAQGIPVSYTHLVQITEADPFELTANIRLVDWETGDYIDDYEPDNGLETIAVADLLDVYKRQSLLCAANSVSMDDFNRRL